MNNIDWSPASRRRGLKHKRAELICTFDNVACFTQAWIETPTETMHCIDDRVACFTQAWIETDNLKPRKHDGQSPASRRRGLKPASERRKQPD